MGISEVFTFWRYTCMVRFPRVMCNIECSPIDAVQNVSAVLHFICMCFTLFL